MSKCVMDLFVYLLYIEIAYIHIQATLALYLVKMILFSPSLFGLVISLLDGN